jgi:hypothetical protein
LIGRFGVGAWKRREKLDVQEEKRIERMNQYTTGWFEVELEMCRDHEGRIL